MRVIVAPDCYRLFCPINTSVFLAGGITDCPDWQGELTQILSESLQESTLTLLNPRRADFDVTNPNIAAEQIEWEFDHLAMAAAISFWFPEETLCPITLFELGKYCVSSDVKLFVGTHPNYKRSFDVFKQLALERPEIKIVHSLGDLAQQIVDWGTDIGWVRPNQT